MGREGERERGREGERERGRDGERGRWRDGERAFACGAVQCTCHGLFLVRPLRTQSHTMNVPWRDHGEELTRTTTTNSEYPPARQLEKKESNCVC